MKETTFKFGVKIATTEAYEMLRNKLAKIKGIAAIELEEETLSVRAFFENGEQAKKIHNKVINALIKTQDVTVTSATTMLTDIF